MQCKVLQLRGLRDVHHPVSGESRCGAYMEPLQLFAGTDHRAETPVAKPPGFQAERPQLFHPEEPEEQLVGGKVEGKRVQALAAADGDTQGFPSSSPSQRKSKTSRSDAAIHCAHQAHHAGENPSDADIFSSRSGAVGRVGEASGGASKPVTQSFNCRSFGNCRKASRSAISIVPSMLMDRVCNSVKAGMTARSATVRAASNPR